MRNKLRHFTEEHRRKISESRKKLKENGWKPYNTGLKTADRKNWRELLLKNMVWHLKRWITIEDLWRFDDIEKLKFLNNVISRHRIHFEDDSKYMAYLDKFYHTEPFNTIYSEWIKSWKCKWKMPSIEHLLPVSRWGNFELDNLCFTTWFENRAKAEMTIEEWHTFKFINTTSSNLFYL